MIELFLICAMSLPSASFTHPSFVTYKQPAVVVYQAMKTDEEKLRDNLKKHPEIEDVFITPEGNQGVLKNHNWDRAPFNINGKEVWIKRRPKNDRAIMTSA